MAPDSVTNESGPTPAKAVRFIGRYALYDAIASGGMATVYVGRLLGPVGFSRTVAIKRLHPQFAADPEFVSMFLDEARLAARIRHPNVVQTLDVVATSGELFLVMDYVHGGSLARLLKSSEQIPLPIAAAIISGTLQGLHAAHEAKSERGEPLAIVHRDVSPQNILVGSDGGTRVLDFGVAKAIGRLQSTREGQLKGKLGYMAPEQLMNEKVGRQLDIYAATVVLWEIIAGDRLFRAESEGAVIQKILSSKVVPASASRGTDLDAATREQLKGIDAVIARGLARRPEDRYQTAHAMALALEAVVTPASAAQVAAWVEAVAREDLQKQAGLVAVIEGESSTDPVGHEGVGATATAGNEGAAAPSAAASEPTDADPTRPHESRPRLTSEPRLSSETEETSTAHLVVPGGIPVDSSVSSSSSSSVISALPVTQSSRSTSQSASRASRDGGWLWGTVAGGLALVCVAFFAFGAGRRASGDGAPPSASVTASTPSAASTTAPAVPAHDEAPAASSVAASPSPNPPVSATPPVSALPPAAPLTPSASTSTPKAVAAGTSPPRPPVGGATVRPSGGTHAAPTGAAPNCEPPFTYDAKGHKHYKPECPL